MVISNFEVLKQSRRKTTITGFSELLRLRIRVTEFLQILLRLP
jgi:hypothetical protein